MSTTLISSAAWDASYLRCVPANRLNPAPALCPACVPFGAGAADPARVTEAMRACTHRRGVASSPAEVRALLPTGGTALAAAGRTGEWHCYATRAPGVALDSRGAVRRDERTGRGGRSSGRGGRGGRGGQSSGQNEQNEQGARP